MVLAHWHFTAFLTLPEEITYCNILAIRRYSELPHCKAYRWLPLEYVLLEKAFIMTK